MAKGSAPICFRVTEAERAVLETVAWHAGMTLSEFIRNVVIAAANGILDKEDAEEIMQRYASSKRQETDAKVQSVLAAFRGSSNSEAAVVTGRRSRGAASSQGSEDASTHSR